MKNICANARTLVPSYLDGELSAEQAAPLREHLLGCRHCREAAKDQKILQRWFVEPLEAATLVPAGFAARVARRAFAGDVGGVAALAASARSRPAERGSRSPGRGTLLPFLLKASSLAAGVLFVLAIGIQRRGLPQDDGLDALQPPPWERVPIEGDALDSDALGADPDAGLRPADEAEEDEGADPEQPPQRPPSR